MRQPGQTPTPSKDTIMKSLAKLVGSVHQLVYRLTGGTIGANFRGGQILLLTTIGRKTGKARTWPLAYFRDGEKLVIVGSNGGLDRDPAWCLNLRRTPTALIQVGRTQLRVRAEEAQGAQRERLWQLVTTQAPAYARYQTMTARPIPLLILHPER
jgi:deazaflavin-dependent oxidoreductase (nitroreductase family)